MSVGKLKTDLLRHAIALIEEQELAGGPMMVEKSDAGY